jgi:chain length determinant protein EpsF
MNFSQFLLVLKARKVVILFTLLTTVATTLAVSLLMPRSYTATTSLVVDFKGADPVSGMALPAQLLPGYMATQVDIIASHNVALKVVDGLKLAENAAVREQFMEATEGRGTIRDWMADLLLKYVNVVPSRESSVVDISYKGSDPQFAAAIANAFAQAYIITNLDLKVEPAKLTAAWFEGQIKALRDNLEKAQANLSAYQREKGIVAVDERLDVENARLQELSSQLVVAQSMAYDAHSRQRQMSEGANKGKAAEALPEIIGNPLIQGMKANLAQAEAKLADVSERAGRNHPEYQRALAEVESLRKKIDTEVKNASSGIVHTASISQARVNDLRSALAAQKAKILELTHKRDDFAVLTREVENAQKMLDAGTMRSGQTRLESQTNQTNIAVLNPAVPPIEPSSPRIPLNIALSVFLGTLLGIGIGFLMEMADRRVRSAEDLIDGLGVPVLGVLGKSVAGKKTGSMERMFRRQAAA